MTNMKEIRFHGRGGQGAVTATELLAVAAADEGKFSQAFPFFGVERRGAPVMSFCRIDKKPIRIHQHVYEPDYVVVLDSSLMKTVDVCAGLKKDGMVIVNAKLAREKLNLKAKRVFVVDATGIALKHIGRPIVNTATLGAFAKVTGLVTLDSLKKAIEERFPEKIANKNIKAIEECFNQAR
jgi:2-oxoacid:acceptor oxidoreductase gamma subunit (pyruvate/2-ketoisovalerate family)